MRTVDPAVFKPRPRVESAILGLRRTGPAADPATRRAGPRRLRPPPQVAGPLARARPRRVAWRRRGRRSPSWACPRTRAPRRSRPSEFAALVREAAAEPELPPDADPRPRQAQPLPLSSGRRRDDGLHELCSLFEPLALADLIEVAEAERDEVVCPGVEGENLAARALAALRERGWERPPLRVEIEKRIPVAAGLGGGSADAAAVLRLAGGRGRRRCDGARRRARRRRALAAAPGAGPGPRRRASGSSRCPSRRARGRPAARRRRPLRTAEVFAEADRLGLGRDAGGARRPRRSACARRPAPAPRRSTTPSCSSTTSSPPARSLRPEIGDALEALREAGAPLGPPHRLRPDRLRALRRPRRGRAAPRRALDRDDAIVCEAGARAMRLPGCRRSARKRPAADRRDRGRDRAPATT